MRRALALGLLTVGLLALLPTFQFVAHAPSLRHPLLVCLFAAVTLGAYLSEVALKTAVPARFDATFAIVLLVVVVAGPLPAAIVWAIPDLFGRVALREYPVRSPGFLANLASYGWATVAAAGVLAVTKASNPFALVPEIVGAGLVLVCVNFAIARLLYGTLYQGYKPGALIRGELIEMLPAILGMIVVVSLIVLLLAPLGILAALPMAALTVIPQIAFPRLVKRTSVRQLSEPRALILYARTLSDAAHIPRRQRRIAIAAAELFAIGTLSRRVRYRDLFDVHAAVFYAAERWDGTGKPGGLTGPRIPAESRILAVAQAWSVLTARGTIQLPHVQALLALQLDAGTRLDPAVVAAAGEIVHSEMPFATDTAFRPTLHRIPLARALRRAMVPRILNAYQPNAT